MGCQEFALVSLLVDKNISFCQPKMKVLQWQGEIENNYLFFPSASTPFFLFICSLIKILNYGEVSEAEIFSRENISSNVEGVVSEIIE